ncbi:hypothetical protein FPV67DRAFT_1561859 [Lyophyllum atratum]|nr:hypothetical protein FPV67DRAFT_1561859 [Lyophyllum atratum]
MLPVLPGNETWTCPTYAFHIEHSATGRQVMIDLGPRKDLENSALAISVWFQEALFSVTIEKDITEQLVEGGIPLESIDTVVRSHTRFDHVGDNSKFPSTTEFVSKIICSVRSLAHIDRFRGRIFLGDSSLYLLDCPHISGHIAAPARVTHTNVLFLGGDTCHHAGQFRPIEKLHRHHPCPGELLAKSRHTPLLQVPEVSFYEDPQMAPFDANDDIFLMIAHDAALVSHVEKNPAKLSSWKAKGLKERAVWGFIDEGNPAFRYGVK